MKSKVDYFDIKCGDEVFELEFCPIQDKVIKDERGQQTLDYYKVLPNKSSSRIHYLFAFEVDV